MAFQKSINSNPYSPNGPYDTTLNGPNILENVNLQEYRPNVTFSITKIYLTSNLPAAASGNLGFIVFVYDAPAGTQLQFSDGSSWISVDY